MGNTQVKYFQPLKVTYVIIANLLSNLIEQRVAPLRVGEPFKTPSGIHNETRFLER